MAKKKKKVDEEENVDPVKEERESREENVTVRAGISEVAKMFGNDPDQMVMSDDEVLENMQKDLEKKIAHSMDPSEKQELEKELLVLKILILQREKIDTEAAIILNNGEAFGTDFDVSKEIEKKKKKKEKQQKEQQELIDKLNEYGISDLNIDIKTPKKSDGREKGGMQRQRTR